MFRGNPAHSGVFEGGGLAQFGGLKWKFHTGGMVIGSAAVSDGRVYFGSTDGMKEHGPAYTKPDGTPNSEVIYRSDFYDDMVAGVDRVMSMGAILSPPVLSGGVVYVGSADGNLYALR